MSKLVEAGVILAERGLTKDGSLEHPDTGCVCVLGALSIAYTGEADTIDNDGSISAYFPTDEEHRADIRRLVHAVRATGFKLTTDSYADDSDPVLVYRYNDQEDRTLNEMLTLIDTAATL